MFVYTIIGGCGVKNPRPYNKSRPQIALYVFSSDQRPIYEAINIWYKAYNTPWGAGISRTRTFRTEVKMGSLALPTLWPHQSR